MHRDLRKTTGRGGEKVILRKTLRGETGGTQVEDDHESVAREEQFFLLVRRNLRVGSGSTESRRARGRSLGLDPNLPAPIPELFPAVGDEELDAQTKGRSLRKTGEKV